jgi:mono/diheme cytochrome c family protein
LSIKKAIVFLLSLAVLGAGLYFLFKGNRKREGENIQASFNNGKKVYAQVCLACHMADGGGVPHMNPPLNNTSYVLGDKTSLIKIVLNGFNEDVQINGKTYSNNMTPHADLSDEQIADALTYVRNSFGNKASAVTADEVKKVRGMISPIKN